MKYLMLALVVTFGLAVSQLDNAATAQGGGAPTGGDAQNAAPQEGGDVAPNQPPKLRPTLLRQLSKAQLRPTILP